MNDEPTTPRDRSPEAARLAAAVLAHPPACEGDLRFSSDAARADRRVKPELRAICAECPLLALCAAYADRRRPAAGFWAGKWRGRATRADDRRTLRPVAPSGADAGREAAGGADYIGDSGAKGAKTA